MFLCTVTSGMPKHELEFCTGVRAEPLKSGNSIFRPDTAVVGLSWLHCCKPESSLLTYLSSGTVLHSMGKLQIGHMQASYVASEQSNCKAEVTDNNFKALQAP